MRLQSMVCSGVAAGIFAVAAAASAALMTSAAAVSAAGPERAATVPTFARDVAPILFKNCTTCHRPGEIAPMSLLTYEDARPYAKAIRDEVGEGHMPPWHADAPAGTFENERRLTTDERQTLLDWVAGGAPKGDPKDLPPEPQYTEGWQVGKPDVVFEMSEDYRIPAEGTVAYEYFYIPTNFTEPKFVQSIEVRPGNRKVVHHALVNYIVKPDMQRTPVLKTNPTFMKLPPPVTGDHEPNRPEGMATRLIGTYAPGTMPQVFRAGTALRLEPGGVIELQMHYTTNGKATTDRTKIGLIFSKDPSPREIRPSNFYNASFTLPALAPNASVPGEVEFLQDATVWGLFPHTHLRGKAWEYKLVMPDGTEKTILSVPHYDFNWQTYYMFKEPLQVPKGAKILSTAWYDNSHGNRSNPNANADVKWGDQTWEEMQYTGILFSPVTPPKPVTAGAGDKPGGRR
jgi:copper type II ascorbate-dependent monooxygenase-like protein